MSEQINTRQFISHVRKYYPPTATEVLVKVSSEYNDEGYDERVKCVVVYNAAGDEIVPIPATADQSRDAWDSFHLPENHEDEPRDDFKIKLNQPAENQK